MPINTAEGGTNGTTVTAANSGGASKAPWDVVTVGDATATLIFDNTHPATGSLGYKFQLGSVATEDYLSWTTQFSSTNRKQATFRWDGYWTGLPAAAIYQVRVYNAAGTTTFGVKIETTGKLAIYDSSGTLVSTMASAVPLNTLFHVEVEAAVTGTSVAVVVRRWDVAGGNYDSVTGTGTVAVPMGRVRFGHSGTGVANVGPWWMDNLEVSFPDLLTTAPDTFLPDTLIHPLDDGRELGLMYQASSTQAAEPVWYTQLIDTFSNLLTANQESLETDASDWTAAGPGTAVAQSALQAHSGTESLRVTWSGSGGIPWAQTVTNNWIIGRTYQLSAWVYVPTGSPDVQLGVAAPSSNGTSTSVKDTWVQITHTAVATSTSRTILVSPTVSTTAGDVYVDDVRVDELGAPDVTDGSSIWNKATTVGGGTWKLGPNYNQTNLPATWGGFIVSGNKLVNNLDAFNNYNSINHASMGTDGRRITFDYALAASGNAAISVGGGVDIGPKYNSGSANADLTVGGVAVATNIGMSGTIQISYWANGNYIVKVNSATVASGNKGSTISILDGATDFFWGVPSTSSMDNLVIESLQAPVPQGVSGTGSLDVSGSGGAQGGAIGTGSLSLSGSGVAAGQTNATGSGSLSLSGAGIHSSTGTGSLSLSGSGAAAAAATASASLSLSGSGIHSSVGTASLSLSGSGVGRGTATSSGALSLSGAGAPTGRAVSTASLSLSGSGAARATTSGSGRITLRASGAVFVDHFDDTDPFWYDGGNADLAVVSGKLEVTPRGAGDFQATSFSIPLAHPGRYVVSISVQAFGSPSHVYHAGTYDGVTQYTVEDDPGVLSGALTTITGSFTAPPSPTSDDFFLEFIVTGGTKLVIDDVVVQNLDALAAVGAGSGSLSLSGSGIHSSTGTASLSLSGVGQMGASGAAALSLSASGSANASTGGSASLSFSGSGVHSSVGTASLSLSGSGATRGGAVGTGSLSLSGTGVQSSVGTASLSLSASGTAKVVAIGAGSLNLSAVGVHSSVGTASLTLSASGSSSTPVAPTGLTVTPVSDTVLLLDWDDYTGALWYDIERDGAVIAQSAVSTYSDTGLSASTQYCYRVRAVVTS